MISSLTSLFPGEKLELCVASYYRGKDDDGSVKRFHRAIFIITQSVTETGYPRGTVFQVIHGRPLFEYMTKDEVDIRQRQHGYSGRVKIGEVRKKDIKKVEKMLSGLEVVRDINSDWGCQAWTREGVRQLTEHGFVSRERQASLDDELARTEKEYVNGLHPIGGEVGGVYEI